MLTITTSTKTIYIDIELLKSRFKRTVNAFNKALTIITGVAGALWVVGATNKDITLYQTINYILHGGVLCGVSYILNALQKRI